MQEAIVQEHDQDTASKGQVDAAEGRDSIGVGHRRVSVGVPGRQEFLTDRKKIFQKKETWRYLLIRDLRPRPCSDSPQPRQDAVLSQHHHVICHHPVARPALLHVKPAEDVDNADHHVEQHLLPLGHAEVSATVHHPERHGAPVDHHEDAKVDVKEGGKKGQRENAGGDGEEAPEDV